MDFLKDIIGSKSSELVSTLVEKSGFSEDQAQAFVPEAASTVWEALKGKAGDLDLAEVASNPGSLTDGLDLSALAQKVGVDTGQASSGVTAILPGLLEALKEKAGGFEKIASLLGGLEGGLGGAVSGLGNKLFGR